MMKKATIEITDTDVITIRTMYNLLNEKYNNPFNANILIKTNDLFKRMKNVLSDENNILEDIESEKKRYFFVGYAVIRGNKMFFGHTIYELDKPKSVSDFGSEILKKYHDNYGNIQVISFSEISQDDYNLLTSDK